MSGLNWAKPLPEAWRLLRVSWRPGRVGGVAGASFAFCLMAFLLVVSQDYLEARQNMTQLKVSYDAYFIVMIVFQSILWGIAAPALVGGAVSNEFEAGTWIFQQTSPQSPVKLALGKMLGGPGDVYVVSLAGAPFFLLSAFMAKVPFSWVISYLFVLAAFSFMAASSAMALLFSVGKQKHSSGILMLSIPILLIFTSLAMGSSPRSGALSDLHPLSVFFELGSVFFKWPESRGGAVAAVRFYGFAFSYIGFVFSAYALWGMVFFISAVRAVKRKMSLRMNALPTVWFFLFAVFFYVGFAFNIKNWFSFRIYLFQYQIIFIGMLYCSILQSSKTLGELRPWIYRSLSEKGARDWLSSEAPGYVAFSGALVATALGEAVLIGLYSRHEEKALFMLNLFFAGLAAITLRDLMFFQWSKLRFKEGAKAGLLIYFVCFLGVPAVLMGFYDRPVVDLSPLSVGFVEAIAKDFEKEKIYFAGYVAGNAALGILFALLNLRKFREAGSEFAREHAQ